MPKLNIMVIEDNPEHMQDAKGIAKQFEIYQAPSSDDLYTVNVEYASTHSQAVNLLEQINIHGILSDIFFPADDNNESGRPKGWSTEIKDQCLEIVQKFYDSRRGYPELPRKKSAFADAIDQWAEGLAMHPTGLVIGKIAKEREIPLAYVTDTYHHGEFTQPVFESGFGKMFDVHTENPDKTKDWKAAFEYLLELARCKVMPELPDDSLFWSNWKI